MRKSLREWKQTSSKWGGIDEEYEEEDLLGGEEDLLAEEETEGGGEMEEMLAMLENLLKEI